ncbi:hypothetical protein JIN84_00420 [Luteolibacter yonseiensis]|uniref:Uncharacterized protein n=1 Tax=Luteolibacter yonseiensis TaxID=1144680 RepID=A0A934V9R6_9BACT|nr:hypothetical protein [Luteolibacter yonseiensis]MBK1814071.1 hypothetical protein [Luteolibacter yonseiensis]
MNSRQSALSLVLSLLSCIAGPARAETPPVDLPAVIDAGAWPAGHVQGIAVDRRNGHIYLSFTRLLVKIDFKGNVIGTIGGFTGHLGDLDIDETNGRIYGSLEYKAENAFYIAIIDGGRIDRTDMKAQDSDIFQTVHLAEVVKDYSADMNADGRFDGDKADTPDHRHGCSGIDGVSFGPRFGRTGGKQYLTVAYGIYSNTARADNDDQILLQYDASDWLARHARPLDEAAPHRSGPEAADGKYFIHTGNTTYGVQNLEYDHTGQRWLMGVYAGKKTSFPNYTLFSVEAVALPSPVGTTDAGTFSLPLSPIGKQDAATGVRGWYQKADVGIAALGDGLFYLATDGKRDGKQTATLTLQRWTGAADKPFEDK